MPAAQTKADLIAVSLKDFAKLEKLLDTVPENCRLIKDEDTSLKDIVGHRAHWIDLFLGWYRDGLAGKTVYFPAEGYKWNDLKRYNADLRAKQSEMTWDDARLFLKDKHAELMSLLDAATENELYGGPMKGANSDWPAGRWAEAAGPSHYRSAAKYIRQRLRALGSV